MIPHAKLPLLQSILVGGGTLWAEMQTHPKCIPISIIIYPQLPPLDKKVSRRWHSQSYLPLVSSSIRRQVPTLLQPSSSSSKCCCSSSNSKPPSHDTSDAAATSFEYDPVPDDRFGTETEIEVEIEIEKLGNNVRRIRSKVAVGASLQTVWNILTDYERLADFIPGLAVSQLLDKRDNFARLFQIGQQNLAFGLKFDARGVVDCYEKDLESLPFGQKRDIEFEMIEGDFQLFQGKWSIEECSTGRLQKSGSLSSQEFSTTLSYVVDVKPKMWLPVRLVEGKLCREIKLNLSCIREAAEKASRKNSSAH